MHSFSSPSGTTILPVTKAAGRVLAAPVYSKWTNPPVVLSGPDGIAVRGELTRSATKETPVQVQAVRVNTGMPMPDGYNAVIRIEDVTQTGEGLYQITTPVAPHENTVPAGVDIKAGELVMDTGHIITPVDVGALLTYGIFEVTVTEVRVGLIATGDEVIPARKIPLPGQIVDSNTHMLAAYLEQIGITTSLGQVVPDDQEMITQEMNEMIKTCDLVLIFGGSSAGTRDFTVDAIEKGGELLFHGVGMAPGKPISLGRVQGKPVFGMPGPAVGSLVIVHEMILPLLRSWGLAVPAPIIRTGELTEQVEGFPGFDLFLMVQARITADQTVITPVPRKFGQMMGVRADAILHVPEGQGVIPAGTQVQVLMIR